MPQPPELEIIDQLEGGDLPLSVVCRFFVDDAQARRVLANYVSRGVVVLLERNDALPIWRCRELLSGEIPLQQNDSIRVSLTKKGARAFADGTWNLL